MPSRASHRSSRTAWIAPTVLTTGAVLAIAAGAALGATTPGAATGQPATASAVTTVTAAPVEPDAGPSDAAATPSPTPDEPVTFTLVAGGDVLPHMPVVRSATTADGIDFAPLLAGVEPFVSAADLALCHMETPVSPNGVASGYPVFAAPPEIVAGVAGMGFDGCSTASNHSVDRGFAGLEVTATDLEEAGLGFAGTARTEEEAAVTQMYEVVGADATVTVANVSYTYGLNGLPKPDGMPWSVNTFDADAADAQPIIDAAARAREQGADVVIASVHCCVEYRTEPTAAQRTIAQAIADSGEVDLYVGHHAHVPQPLELLDGGPSGEGMWTAYGLGNFLSNQGPQCCVADTNSGALLSATLTVPSDGPVTVQAGWTGVTVDRLDGHRMYVLSEILDDGAGSMSAVEARERHARVAAAMGEDAPEVTSPVEAFATSVTPLARTADAVAATASPSPTVGG
ncbi:CapA family protein [Demequina sp. NBRC 110051]|uniref:CapA family protein n=1 Tax=Demequina sp. NBRC 110051 TaxID=1570340 RepID=UPI0009FF6C05|nr:CapA family protein [Demequina sp. NBRC 110051]